MEDFLREITFDCKTLFRRSPVGMVIAGADERIIHFNDAFCRFLGYSAEELMGKTITEITHPKDFNRGMQELKSIIDGAIETATIQNRYLRKDGTIAWGEMTICLFPNERSKPLYLLIMIQDISECKDAEEKRKMEGERFRAMIDNAPLGAHLYELTPDNRLIFIGANRSADIILAVKNDQFIGKTIEEAFPKLVTTTIPDAYRDVARSGIPFNMEQILYSDDQGISGVFEISAFQTETNKMAVLFRDITEKKKAEEALQASERRFKELIKNSTDSITILDKNGQQIHVSEVVEKMLGYNTIELLNIPVVEQMIHPEDQAHVQEAFSKIIREGQGGAQYRHRHKNGTWVHLEAWGTNQLENPDIRGVVVNVRDITDRKRAEAENEQLMQRLNQIQKLESLGVLAGGIAHDFNNLLGGIFGYIDLAHAETTEKKICGYLSKSLNALDRARALTQQLLTFAKGGTPIRQVDHFFPFLHDTIQFALSGSSVSCVFNIQENLWPANFDKNQVGQVFQNIVINAQQAMPNGGIIEITARNITLNGKETTVLPAGNYVKISVKDCGIGIPEEFLPRIFDPFYTTKPKGHGLGLATCYSIVKRHGGGIDVESESGKGSIFHVYLPALIAAVPVKDRQPNDIHTGSGIFVVMDDEELIRETIQKMLESFGYTVVLKENGKDAVDFFTAETKANRAISGMIFDLTIPGAMGGKEAVREVRKIDVKIPVFVASGYADDPVMAHPEKFGFSMSICKPFRTAELAKMLNRFL